ncbi:chromaffin granule amine transporter-like [Aricia agestis]|uniref:chromaffin granule amine transporter-like n=1 Tax=Aricia agestis TaxID=91739 RepID=UPI001C2061EE|nr:chromaffin granule amine transporter-like [Aricia agestis]
MEQIDGSSAGIAFAVVYFTFFLDNVLLTVLVPIIPDWVRGEALSLWAQHGAPLAGMLNVTVQQATEDAGNGIGTSQAIVGAVLSAKAAVQLAAAPTAAAYTARAGPAAGLRVATALLAAAAAAFSWCGRGTGGAACAGVARATQGAGAALAGVAGVALVARALPPAARHRALAALLGAVALGVLVGYPFGGAAYKLWSPVAPFQLILVALLFSLLVQYLFLDKEQYNRGTEMAEGGALSAVWGAGRGVAGACAGAVLLTTSVMAALEPCLPLWIIGKFHPERWALGVVFIPDSAGYLLATSTLGGVARRLGAERVALTGQLAVGVAALVLPHATSVPLVGVAQGVLGAGLGATDAALLPALLARTGGQLPRAALLQAAASAAYAAGPIVGGVISWGWGFESALRTFGVANLLYAAYLYRALRADPLSEQWGASVSEDESDTGEELTPLGQTR